MKNNLDKKFKFLMKLDRLNIVMHLVIYWEGE